MANFLDAFVVDLAERQDIWMPAGRNNECQLESMRGNTPRDRQLDLSTGSGDQDEAFYCLP